MKLEKLSYSLRKTAEEIKQAGIKFQKSIEPCIAEDSSDELILEGKISLTDIPVRILIH